MKQEGIKVKGHIGTWYVVDTYIFRGQPCYELEHEEFGSDAAHIIINSNGTVLHDEVWNGWLDVEEKYGKEIYAYQNI